MQYIYAIVGGTFDHFHAGHKKLLFETCSQSQKIVIGVATEALYLHKILKDSIEDFETRKQAVLDFVQESEFISQVSILPLSDIYGNALEEKEIDAIFVTEDTKPNALVINKKRKELGLSELTIITVPFVLADDREKISSDRIRLGEIDRNGFSYKTFLKRSEVLHLPDSFREELRKPIGNVVQNLTDPSQTSRSNIISVGDIVTHDLIAADVHPTISIIDFKTQREEIVNNQILDQLKLNAVQFKNQAARINTQFADLFLALIKSYVLESKHSTIIVDGEEDLLTLPAILLAPLGSHVIYGQHNIGAVIVDVTEKQKKEVLEILENFKSN